MTITLQLNLSSSFCTAYPTQCHVEPRVYPKGLRAQGRGCPGQGAKPSQETITHSAQFRDGNQPTCLGNSEETGQPEGNLGIGLKPLQPCRCLANLQTTKPPNSCSKTYKQSKLLSK